METLESISSKIQQAYDKVDNWRAVGDLFGISGGMAFRIAREKHDPKDAHIRTKLGLPAYVPTVACAKCGDVHTLGEVCTKETPVKVVAYKVTSEELAQIEQPFVVVYESVYETTSKKKKSKPRTGRATINLADPASAARTILTKMSAENIQRMIAALQKGD